MLREVAQWFLWFVTYSFVGWVYESTLCSITQKKLVNRGFLNGPLCPIYGGGALVVVFFLGSEADGSALSLFLSGAVLTCTLEYLTSWVMEKLFHTRWWDYSHYRFNLNGRVCLLGAVAFGAMSVLVLKVVHPYMQSITKNIPTGVLYILCFIVLALLAADTVVTVCSVLSMNQKLAEVQIALDRLKESVNERKTLLQLRGKSMLQRLENSADLTTRMKELLNQRKIQERRLLRAFPKMRSDKHEALAVIKAKLEELKRDKTMK